MFYRKQRHPIAINPCRLKRNGYDRRSKIKLLQFWAMLQLEQSELPKFESWCRTTTIRCSDITRISLSVSRSQTIGSDSSKSANVKYKKKMCPNYGNEKWEKFDCIVPLGWGALCNHKSFFVLNSHAINEMHKNELRSGGQNLWYITGQLLVGTVLYHQRQVDFVYGAHSSHYSHVCYEVKQIYYSRTCLYIFADETRLLQQKFLSKFVILRKTQTIKRRT